MGLRKGAVKWGVVFLFFGIVISLAYLNGPPVAEAQEPTGNFSYHGYVKNSTGGFLSGVNITIEAINFSAMGFGPPPIVGVFSNISGSDGFFNITDIQGGVNYNIRIKKFRNDNQTVTYIGPTLPPFPQFFYTDSTFGILNATFILQKAGNINLSVFNNTGRVTFTYELIDKKLGFPIESPDFNESNYVTEKIVHVPYNRNYTIQFHSFQTPPIEFTLNNLSAHNTTPNCLDNADCVFSVNVSINNTFSPVNVYGFINTTDFGTFNASTANLTNLSVVTYLVFAGENVMSEATMPQNIGQFLIVNGTPDIINATGGSPWSDGPFYNITLVGTTTGFEVLMVFYGYGNSSENPDATNLYYAGFQSIIVSVGEPDRRIDITLQRLAGATGTQTFSSEMGFGGISPIVTNLTTINLVTTDSNESVGQAHMEARLTYALANDSSLTKRYRWFLSTNQQTSSVSMPIPNTTTDLRLQIFSQNFAPIKKKISNALLNSNSTLNISLFTMDIGDPDSEQGSGDHVFNVQMDFYTSSATCDVPTPPATCSLTSFGTAQEFNPMKAMLGGEVSLRMTHTNGVTVHYANVDMMASGPPDASMDTEAGIDETSGDNFDEIWKFGSFGPDVYDFILVGIPYSDNPGDLDDSATVTMNMPLLYDDDWTVLWNTSANGTNASFLAGNFSDYAGSQSDWQALMNNNNCVTDTALFNSSAPCYINSSANLIWIRIPHFSGTGPSITGSTVAAAPSPPSDGGDGGGGGGGGAPSEVVKLTKIWGLIAPAEQAEFILTKDEIAIKKITFTVINQALNAKLVVEALTEKPSALPDPSGSVFQFLELTPTNLESSNIQAATITFSVNKSWLTPNGVVDKDTVVLLRYADDQWNELETTLLSENAASVEYQVSTPGFSTFVISGTAPPAPEAVCGDGVCDATESFESCPADCPLEEVMCNPGEIKCEGNSIVQCISDGSSFATIQTCSYGCNNGACNPEPIPTTGGGEVPLIPIVVVIIVVLLGLLYYFRIKK